MATGRAVRLCCGVVMVEAPSLLTRYWQATAYGCDVEALEVVAMGGMVSPLSDLAVGCGEDPRVPATRWAVGCDIEAEA